MSLKMAPRMLSPALGVLLVASPALAGGGYAYAQGFDHVVLPG